MKQTSPTYREIQRKFQRNCKKLLFTNYNLLGIKVGRYFQEITCLFSSNYHEIQGKFQMMVIMVMSNYYLIMMKIEDL